ncbi:hypothetical protein SAMN05192558_109316 [Actinokineospora alba]|uniref:Uncharacterized protein n=1 Tax=Actinokineospora alba TaxID=504798 RepID=A0A1H0T8H1_9PSEU|nr:hypothetical protein [Actinokineospora alba]TDP66323.1 hypothetical protein C8E96_1824 [Actinokineospora alba]SDJ21982.1 hypothetical protein SAMN05421871_11159 [Actinokineospora alba]SDP50101.1 hypothetical protein SAMN05192558_109316 [Actinokineospora alba]
MNHDHDQTPGSDCQNCEYEFGYAPPNRRASDRLPCGHYEDGDCNDNCDCYYD